MERRVLQEFIELYKSEPSLWQVRSPHYNNRQIKALAYRKMVAKLREIYPAADLDSVKKKVNALRTNYRKELRKVLASRERHASTGEPVYVPSLWYYDLFHFIAEDHEEDHEIIDVTAEATAMVGFEQHSDGESDEFEDEFQMSSPDMPNHTNRQPHTSRNFTNNNHRSSPPFKRPRDFEDEDEEDPDKWFYKRNDTPTPELDHEEIFGRYVSSKLKQMDKSQQMLSERLISEVLFRGQMGLLTRKMGLSDDRDTASAAVKVDD